VRATALVGLCPLAQGVRPEYEMRVSALDAPPVKESPATEDQQHYEDDEERVRIHGVSCLRAFVGPPAFRSAPTARIADGLLIAYTSVARRSGMSVPF
jgi:hypothetical protein